MLKETKTEIEHKFNKNDCKKKLVERENEGKNESKKSKIKNQKTYLHLRTDQI